MQQPLCVFFRRLKEAACCAAANAATTPVFVACFNDYIVRELGYKTERRYYLLGGFPGFRWHYPENGNRARSDCRSARWRPR